VGNLVPPCPECRHVALVVLSGERTQRDERGSQGDGALGESVDPPDLVVSGASDLDPDRPHDGVRVEHSLEGLDVAVRQNDISLDRSDVLEDRLSVCVELEPVEPDGIVPVLALNEEEGVVCKRRVSASSAQTHLRGFGDQGDPGAFLEEGEVRLRVGLGCLRQNEHGRKR